MLDYYKYLYYSTLYQVRSTSSVPDKNLYCVDQSRCLMYSEYNCTGYRALYLILCTERWASHLRELVVEGHYPSFYYRTRYKYSGVLQYK